MSKIRINANIKPLPPVEHTIQEYNPVLSNGEMTEETLVGMIKDIKRLDKESHAAIYKIIRSVKPASFFAVNTQGTHFNIFNLPDKVKWEIHRLCNMTISDQQRQKVIKTADESHSQTIEHLNEVLKNKL
jgi:hypothetical protein